MLFSLVILILHDVTGGSQQKIIYDIILCPFLQPKQLNAINERLNQASEGVQWYLASKS